MTQKDIHTTSVTVGDVTESMKETGQNLQPTTYPKKCRNFLNQSDSVLPLLNHQRIDRANLSSDIREAQLKGQFERRQGYVNSFIGKSSIEDV